MQIGHFKMATGGAVKGGAVIREGEEEAERGGREME